MEQGKTFSVNRPGIFTTRANRYDDYRYLEKQKNCRRRRTKYSDGFRENDETIVITAAVQRLM